MLLFIENIVTDERQSYRISRLEDFEQLYSLYPATKRLVLSSYSVQDAAERVARYLNSHHMNAWTDKSDLNKSVKNHAMALGLTVAGMLGAGATHPAIAMAPDTLKQSKTFNEKFGSKPEDAFLWSIMHLESSGGRNTNHPPVQAIRYRNQKALGKWGLLTSTIKELVARRRATGAPQKGFSEMEEMGNEDLKNYIAFNPHIELELARHLAKYVLKRQNGDHRRAAYSWLNGHNLAPHEISDADLSSSEYVSNYKAADKLNPVRPKPKSYVMKKAQVDGEFKTRLRNWKKVRFEQKRDPLPPVSNFAPDPGRVRDKELDERPKGEITGNVRDRMADAINAAKKGVKKI